jgi:hypothetical protein
MFRVKRHCLHQYRKKKGELFFAMAIVILGCGHMLYLSKYEILDIKYHIAKSILNLFSFYGLVVFLFER